MNKTIRVSERLREAMTRADKRQADLVRETGLDRGSISSYLSGKYEPKQNAIFKLAKALNVNEAWLMGYDVEMSRTPEQKKTDQLTALVDRMRADNDFFETVVALGSLSEAKYLSIKQLLDAMQE